MGKKEKLNRISDKVTGLLSLCFFVAVLITGYEVVSRYVFNSPTVWVHEMTIMLVAFGFMLGGIVTLYQRTHIAINIIADKLNGITQTLLQLFASIVSVFYLATVSYGSFIITQQAWVFGETSGTAWNSPMPVILKTLLTLCLIIMLAIATYQMVKHSVNISKQVKTKLAALKDKGAGYGY